MRNRQARAAVGVRIRADLRRGSGSLAAAALLFVAAFASDAGALPCAGPCSTQTVAGPAQVSSQSSFLGAGTDFMQRLGALAWYKSGASAANNPQGGGAEEFGQRYRTWLEGYDTWSRMDSQGTFPGDHRHTYGGVAGFGVTVTPGVTLGLSVDQSRTKIDVTGNTQTGRIDLTQIGAIAAFEHGPWNLGATVVRGFGSVHSNRFAVGGASTASYFANLWGAMIELSYFHALPDNWRIVPKLTFDWMRAESDTFTETGGVAPVSGSSVVSSRTRMMLGAEVGHSWLLDRTIMDLAVYGRLVDNLSQQSGTLTVSDPTGVTLPATLLGLRESTLGADTGATLSAKVSELWRFYAAYDGRFRSNFTSHTGTVGAELRF